MMDFSMCPRAKRTARFEGEFRFPELKVFAVGDISRFVRILRVLSPALSVREVPREEANVVFSVATVFSQKNEYCYLRILKDRMEIHARDEMGARNAGAILAQLLREDGKEFLLPCGTVEDWPDAQFRGYMLESSGRAWLPMDEIRDWLRLMGLARFNQMVFNFMEDPGTTVPLDCYPDLAGDPVSNRKYAKDEVREMIAYADDLGITVTPFVEVLSHSVDFTVKAGIACPGDDPKTMFAVCLGQEKTFEAIGRVLAEVAELFPSPVLHVGGDEYDMRRGCDYTAHWDKCPLCQAKMKELGITTMREYFHYGLERVNTIVNKLGKITMVWNADMKPGELPDRLSRNMIVHYFNHSHPYAKELLFNLYPDGYVKDGYTVVNSYYANTYLNDEGNYARDKDIITWSYLRSPAVAPENRAKIAGGCACAWVGESFPRVVPPSIFLYGDRLWNADDSGVLYDDEYGRTVTRALFDGKLPEDMNVFRIVGGMLPPQDPDRKVRVKAIYATPNKVREIKRALEDLAAKGHRLAAIYADMAAAAEEYVTSQPEDLWPKGYTQ